MKIRRVGTVAIVAPVIISSQSVVNSPENAAKPTGIVKRSDELVTINGHRNAVQLPRKMNIARAAKAGATSGKAISHQI